jgi:hypothetical protein
MTVVKVVGTKFFEDMIDRKEDGKMIGKESDVLS